MADKENDLNRAAFKHAISDSEAAPGYFWEGPSKAKDAPKKAKKTSAKK